MDISGLREIKKRIDSDLSNYKSVYGCYVNVAGEVVAKFAISTLDMTAEEKEMYSKLLKKIFSGKQDKNLLDIELQDSANQTSLYALANSRLDNAELRDALYSQIIESLDYDKNYCILLVSDTYDIKPNSDEVESESQYTYFCCAVCPIKETKAELRYMPSKEEFRSNSTGNVLAAPVIGFSYPAFVDRGADLYNAVYFYNKEVHEELIEGVFGTSAPKTAEEIKEEFHSVLADTLDDDYSLENTALLQAKMTELGDTENTITATDIKEALLGSIDEDKLDDMVNHLDASYNIDTLSDKKFQIETTETTIITADPAGLKIQEIDNRKYILVPASGVKVNGKEVVVK